ncbi:MAG: ribose-phosphate diphosphokinase [Chloroflexi bacterium]|nr:ribose-phosphate diphosphokinase [Chloroflexota bacterium]
MYGDIKLLAGTACETLAEEIADYLTTACGIPVTLLDREIYKFANDNTFVQLGESTRGQDVYLIQTMDRPVNDNIMELLITLDAVRRDSAGRITAVIPYMSYTRTDKKDLPRTPITARLLADMIQVAGADRYITIDLHALQIQGFFSIPGDVLSAFHMMSDYVMRTHELSNLTVCTVDLGFAKGGRNWAHALGTPVAFVEKKRTGAVATAMAIVGDVKGRDILLVDDEVDTGGSVYRAIELLDEAGARRISVAFTHPVFSGPALERLAAIGDRVDEYIFTNTIEHEPATLLPNMTVLSVADLLGEVIRRAHQGISVGAMFQD